MAKKTYYLVVCVFFFVSKKFSCSLRSIRIKARHLLYAVWDVYMCSMFIVMDMLRETDIITTATNNLTLLFYDVTTDFYHGVENDDRKKKEKRGKKHQLQSCTIYSYT